uniref:Uncharacterized protein n=1 Tax=Rhizophora mucronata TaxID=61149 RepID=A0A2P2P971_RHIMU
MPDNKVIPTQIHSPWHLDFCPKLHFHISNFHGL